jgi:hypothetical protein
MRTQGQQAVRNSSFLICRGSFAADIGIFSWDIHWQFDLGVVWFEVLWRI